MTYRCGVREVEGLKVPDVPEHVFYWRKGRTYFEYDEKGEVVEKYEITEELEDTEFEKIRGSIEIVKVKQL